MSKTTSRNMALLPANWQVPQVFRDRLGAQAGRQRLMAAEDHLLLVTHKPPKPDDEDREARFFWRQPDGVWSSSDLGGGPGAISKHLDGYAAVIDQCEDMEHSADGADDYFATLDTLSPVHRAVRNLHGVLQEARQQAPQDRELINLRDRSYELERRAELLYGGAKNSLDFLVARRAEEQAKTANQMALSAHRLNILAAFFFPLATLSSIFGMSILDGWKTGAPPTTFVAVIVVGLAMGFGLHAWVNKKTA